MQTQIRSGQKRVGVSGSISGQKDILHCFMRESLFFLMRSQICSSPAIKLVSGMREAIHCFIPQGKSNDWEMIQQRSVIHGAWESCSRQNASLQSIIPETP